MAEEPTLLRTVVETLIRLVRSNLHQKAVLIAPNDQFEIKDTPSLVLIGPAIQEDKPRRSLARWFETTGANVTVRRHPRLYHLDFEVVVTTASGAELLDFHEKVARFLASNATISIPDRGELALTTLEPLGGYHRVNLSNLRQASGRFRIEDVPVWDDDSFEAKIIHVRTFEFRDERQMAEDRSFGEPPPALPPDEDPEEPAEPEETP